MISFQNSDPSILSVPVTFDATSSRYAIEKQNCAISSIAGDNYFDTQRICSSSDDKYEEGSCSSFDLMDYLSSASYYSSSSDLVSSKNCRWHDSMCCSCKNRSVNIPRRVSFGIVTIRRYSEPTMGFRRHKTFENLDTRKKATNSASAQSYTRESTTVFRVVDYERIRPKKK